MGVPRMRRSVLVDFGHPHLHLLKGLAVGDVVDDDDAVGAAVVATCDRSEAILACSVPLGRRKMIRSGA